MPERAGQLLWSWDTARVRHLIVACLAVFACSVGTAVQCAGAAAVAPSRPTVIRLVSTTTGVALLVDTGAKGLGIGDTIWSTSILSNAVAQFGRAKGATVGIDAGRATHLGTKSEQVDVVATLPGGTIHIKGRSRRAGATGVLPVVGGTGLYAGAHGTLSVRDIPGGPRSTNVYRLHYTQTVA